MKALILISTLILSGQAYAAGSIHQFSCVTAESIEKRGHRGPTRFSFEVEKLEQGKVAYSTDDEDSDQPVRMVPENSVLMLNDNWGIRRNEKGIKLDSDGDGIQWTTVQLYKDSGYRAGYAHVEFYDSTKPIYTKVSCRVTERR